MTITHHSNLKAARNLPTKSARPVPDSDVSELSELGSQTKESEFDDNVSSIVAENDEDGDPSREHAGMTWQERKAQTFVIKRQRRAKPRKRPS